MYIHELDNWPSFEWDSDAVNKALLPIRHRQGRLIGRMESLGFSLQNEAMLETMTLEVIKTSEIEGEMLDSDQVRSSIARRMGMDIAGLVPSDRSVDGVVEMMLDATQRFDRPLTQERLFDWHASLFPAGRSGMQRIAVGVYRDDAKGLMQVVSGPIGGERVHFQAPAATRLQKEMDGFLRWFNEASDLDPILKAALAHLWFVTIHPFDDGNGRIARTITDMQLSRADGVAQRFYSMSAQIRLERKGYYDILEKTQGGSLDITPWLEWFLACLDKALHSAERTVGKVLHKARFWERIAGLSLNERQRLMVNKLLDGFVGKLTSSKWAKIARCSQDTALRDIQSLIQLEILKKEDAGGRSTSYILASL